MNILSIGNDRSIFDADAPIRARLLEQASLVSSLHVIVFTPKGEQYKKFQLGRHVTIYPTCSEGKFAYLPDAYAIGKSLLEKKAKGSKWLVTTQDPFETGALGYLLSRTFRVPLHLQIHTDPFSMAWRREKFANRFRFLMMRFLLTKAAGIRVVSERVRRAVLRIGIVGSRITKVPIFVDVSYFMHAKPTFDLHQSYPEFEKVILSMGRLQPEKNYHGLIRAFAEVCRTHDGVLLLIVGSGPERERLLGLARALGVGKMVKILPWARDVASYYKTCDIYVQPSRYEGWGLAVVEAMASGAPVVMTDVGCAGEVVRSEETGLVVTPQNKSALVFALSRLLQDHALCLSLSANGQKEVQKLATKAETLVLYQESWQKALAQKTGNRPQ